MYDLNSKKIQVQQKCWIEQYIAGFMQNFYHRRGESRLWKSSIIRRSWSWGWCSFDFTRKHWTIAPQHVAMQPFKGMKQAYWTTWTNMPVSSLIRAWYHVSIVMKRFSAQCDRRYFMTLSSFLSLEWLMSGDLSWSGSRKACERAKIAWGPFC